MHPCRFEAKAATKCFTFFQGRAQAKTMTQISISIISAFPSCSATNRFQPNSGDSDRSFSRQRLLLHQKQRTHFESDLLQCKVSRREAALLSFLALVPSLTSPDSAAAFSIGISGPKEWLKEQKKKASRFLLAPIEASRESLQYAYMMLTAERSGSANDMDEIQRLIGSAARDCVPKERNSFVEFQANTGVEVCTFSLLVKNAASLLGDKDPVKLEAETKWMILLGLLHYYTAWQIRVTSNCQVTD
uniref:Uncharacterized protein n=1 Tax=Kalanchoe fedtschenkoi TaxID=63787 RepID=A0A7N1A8R3_KALFE